MRDNENYALWQRQMREVRKDLGRCIECDKDLENPKRVRCNKCLERARELYHKRHEK